MTNKEVITSPLTGDSLIHFKHSSGLDVYVCEMPGFSSVNALFAAKYGSLNTTFRKAGEEHFTTIPEGTAHFLEHKLFEDKDRKEFDPFAKTGASGNAFTSFDKTCYFFSCSKNYTDSLEILLDFVQKPYFTKENVAKEMGIIGQEIKMTNDNPDSRIFYNLAKCMFHNHPVKTDIAGTAESIAKIDADLLYKCYDTFYNLNNMVLSISGNVSVDEIISICDKCLKPCENNGLETVMPFEPEEIVSPEIHEKFPVGTDFFQLGFKCRPRSGMDLLKASMTGSVAASIISDASTDMYKQLLSREIINSSFNSDIISGDGFFAVIFSGESLHPDTVRDAVIAEIDRIKRDGVSDEIFQRIKRSTYGLYIRELNNVEAVAGMMMNSHLEGYSPYDPITVLSELSADDVYNFICSELRSDRLVLSVIERMV